MRNNQDEYLEWAVIKEGGKITKVMFTCEGPEYWSHVASDKGLLTKLYSDIVGQPVPQSELFTARSLPLATSSTWRTRST